MLGPGEVIEIDLVERIKNMAPGQAEDVQAIIVDTLRKEAFRILQESKYEDVIKARNTGPFFQVNSHTLRAYGLKLGEPPVIKMPHELSKEKILYYTGVDHSRIIAENYAKNPWPNVGTIGHCDHPYSVCGPYAFETPLFYAIKQAITKL